MEIGIFAKTWAGLDLDQVMDRMTALGIRHTQFNMSLVMPCTMPEEIPTEVTGMVRDTLERHRVHMAAVSGTFNMIHPDPAVVADGLRRLSILAAACPSMGTNVITLCTGSRDAADMWRWHPGNDSPEAWSDLLDAMERALAIADATKVILVVEPEQDNVINSAQRARRLLDHFRSPRLGVIMDPANLFDRGAPAEIERIVDEAFDLLAGKITLAHAKDRDARGRAVAAGRGVLNYDHYLARLQRMKYRGALILHGLSAAEAPDSVAFLREKCERTRGGA